MTRLFLSYARGDDEPFVKRLCEDLTARGFDVWFDRESMPSRNLTFHQEIRDAVAACDRLVLVVGPGAAASDYVRQEWQFAYFEADKVVTPILRLGDYPLAIDELKLVHCEDFRDDAEYQVHLKELVRILKEPPPPLGKLIGVPSLPAHFLSRSAGLTKLRDALRADLDSPVVIGGAAAKVGLHGMGGIGKSVLANALVRDRKVREAFPDGIVWVRLGSLPDLAERMREVHRALGGDGAFATEHEGKTALKELLADKAVLLVLDDAWRRGDVDAFDVLGPRCRALITTRDVGLATSLSGTHYVVELLTESEALRLLAVAAGVESDALPPEAHAVLAECGKLPLAVALAGGMVRAGRAWGEVLGQLQQARIDRIADRHAVEPQHRSVWHAIHVSVEFLRSDEQLPFQDAAQRFLELGVFPADEATPDAAIATLWSHTGGLDDWDSQELLMTLAERSLLQLSTEPRPGSDTPIRHISLHDLVHDYVQHACGDRRTLHKQLLAAYQRKCPDGWWSGPDDGYFLDHLRDHLIASGHGEKLADLLHELQWLETKNKAGLVFDLTYDLSTAIEVLAETDDRRRMLKLLDEALRRDLHFIARHREDYQQGLFQCVWNHGWWYDCPQAAEHYLEPEGGWSEPPPWQREGPKLSALLEEWRAAKQRREPGFHWLRSLRPPEIKLARGQCLVMPNTENGRGGVHGLVYTPDGRHIVSGSGFLVQLWNAVSGEIVASLRGHEEVFNNCVLSVAVSPDGLLLASGDHSNTVRVWNTDTGEPLLTFSHDPLLPSPRNRIPMRPVGPLVFSMDSQRLLSFGPPRPRVVDLQSGVAIDWPDDHDRSPSDDAISGIRSLQGISADWSRVFGEGADGGKRVWDAKNGETILIFGKGYRYPWAMSWDGHWIAITSYSGEVEVWSVTSGHRVALLRGNDDVFSLAFSPDGRRLASGGNRSDKSVRLWEVSTSQMLGEFHGHESDVLCLTFSPDGRRIASGGRDMTIRVWEPETSEERHDIPAPTYEGPQELVAFLRLNSFLGDESGTLTFVDSDSARFPWQIQRRDFESVIISVATGKSIAWFPVPEPLYWSVAPPDFTKTHSSGRTWAGVAGNYCYLFTLEGNAPAAS